MIIVSLVWLVFELSIFRDASFKDPWIYVAIMMGIGLIYFVYMLATQRSFAMPGKAIEPEDVALRREPTERRAQQDAAAAPGSGRGTALGPPPGTAAPRCPAVTHPTVEVERMARSTSWPTTPAPAATRRC